MKAIVCDKCGKVIVLPDDYFRHKPTGVCFLSWDREGFDRQLELCEDCADELIEAVRRTEGNE